MSINFIIQIVERGCGEMRTKAKKRISKIQMRESLNLTLLALPGIILLFIFNYIPMGGAVIAFKNYKPLKGIWGSEWCGFENFRFFFESSDAVRVLRNTLGYSSFWIITGVITGVGMALMFYNLRSKKALKFYNTAVILPRFLSAVIVAFLVSTLLNTRYGLLNQLILAVGGEKIMWYSEPGYWPVILTIVHIWCDVGMTSVIYYSALMSLDESLIEAAKLDGANKIQQIFHVMIPHLIPIIIIQVILAIGKMFSGDFGLFYQVPMDSGALYPTTDIINTYTYRALTEGSLARSTAVGLFQSAAGFVMVVITNAIVRKISPENSLF